MASKKSATQPAALVWNGAEFPRIPAGVYQAVCTGHQGPSWVRAFSRWSLRLEFCLLEDGTAISCFFNMGENKEAPQIGRKSRFFAAWCQANGGFPRKGQEMALATFTEPGLIFTVEVEDSTRDSEDKFKPDSLIYSRVTKILNVHRP